MKSFIETQRALLGEIQNGCKRNFILAKEKEETEQKMRQSASMAEIATEDGTGEEEEEQPASEESKSTEGKVGEAGETTGNEGQTSDQQEVSAETSAPQLNLESDSDTEDEEEVVTKSSPAASSSTHSNQTPQIKQGAAQPLLSASRESSPPSASPAGVISGITVTESAAPPGTPPSPGRCISVSSPGRGHKIFMVTRVESPPEQQQLQLQLSKSAAPSQTKGSSEKPIDANTTAIQRTQPPASSQTPSQTQLMRGGVEENSPAPSTDCKLVEQSPVAHVQATPNTTHTHTLQPQSASPPTEDVTASTLHPVETNPSQQTPTRPSDSSSVQLTDETAESAESCQTEPACGEGQKEGEDEDGCREDQGQVTPHGGTEGERERPDELSLTQTSIFAEEAQQQQPLASAQEQLQNEVAVASEETQSLEPREEEEAAAPKDAPGSLSENETPSLTMKEEPCPHQPAGSDERGVEADQREPSVTQGGAQAANPPPAEHSANPEPASAVSVPPVEAERSPEESSADGGECCAEAPEEDVVGSALPNGLKPEFSLHLLDTESTKPSSCVMEHGELHRHELKKLPRNGPVW